MWQHAPGAAGANPKRPQPGGGRRLHYRTPEACCTHPQELAAHGTGDACGRGAHSRRSRPASTCLGACMKGTPLLAGTRALQTHRRWPAWGHRPCGRPGPPGQPSERGAQRPGEAGPAGARRAAGWTASCGAGRSNWGGRGRLERVDGFSSRHSMRCVWREGLVAAHLSLLLSFERRLHLKGRSKWPNSGAKRLGVDAPVPDQLRQAASNNWPSGLACQA